MFSIVYWFLRVVLKFFWSLNVAFCSVTTHRPISFNQLLKFNDYYEGKLSFISNWNRSTVLWLSGLGIFLVIPIAGFASILTKSKTPPNPYFSFGSNLVFWGFLSTFFLGIVFLKKGSSSVATNNFYHGSARFATEKEIKEIVINPNQSMPLGGFFLSNTNKGVVVLPRMEAVKHGLILGGSGTGKSRGYFLPNCAWRYRDSNGEIFYAKERKIV